MHPSLVLASALLLTAGLSAQGRHVFDIDAPSSGLSLSGNVVVSGITNPLVITPSTVSPTGAFAADLTGSTSITTGQFVPQSGIALRLPPLTAVVPPPLPFLPPLGTVNTTAIEFELESVDAMFNPVSFPVAGDGSFSTMIQLRGISGQAVATGLVNATVDLAAQRSDPTPITGSLNSVADGFDLALPLNVTFQLSVPPAIINLTLTGSVNAGDRFLVAPTDSFPAVTGGTQTMFLSAGTQNAGFTYFVGTSAAGTSPGFMLPNGGPIMPLNVDGFFIASLQSANAFPWGNNLGTLDSLGRATSTFSLPPAPFLLGLSIDHAFFTVQGPNFQTVSNTVPLTLN